MQRLQHIKNLHISGLGNWEMSFTELENTEGGERKVRTSVLFVLRFEVLIRHP